jgi:hypothetical protein
LRKGGIERKIFLRAGPGREGGSLKKQPVDTPRFGWLFHFLPRILSGA